MFYNIQLKIKIKRNLSSNITGKKNVEIPAPSSAPEAKFEVIIKNNDTFLLFESSHCKDKLSK